MKNNKRVLYLVAAIVLLVAGIAWAAWDVNSPSGNTLVSNVDNIMRADKAQLMATIGAEHVFTASDQSGLHKEGSAVLNRDVDANTSLLTPREGRLYYASDTHKLYIGNSTPAWQQEQVRHNTYRGGTSYVTDTSLPTATTWTAIPGMPAQAFVPTGDIGSTCDVLITVTLVARCDTDNEAILFDLFIDGVSVTTSGSGLAVVGHSDNSSLNEAGQTITMTWLATGVTKDADGISIAPMYKMAAGVTGTLPLGFRSVWTVVEL